jgi:hypothetical protein
MSRAPFIAMCVCGRVYGGWTLGAAERWRTWHEADGCEGCDHVVAIRYESASFTSHPTRSPRP